MTYMLSLPEHEIGILSLFILIKWALCLSLFTTEKNILFIKGKGSLLSQKSKFLLVFIPYYVPGVRLVFRYKQILKNESES